MFSIVPNPNALDNVFQIFTPHTSIMGRFSDMLASLTKTLGWRHSYACYFRSGLLCVKRVTSAQTLTHLTQIQDRCLTESKRGKGE